MGYTINNITKKITLVRGDTLKAQIEIIVDGEVYTPTENDIIRFAMKRSYECPSVLVEKVIPNDSLILKLEPSDTKRLPFDKYVYDIEITFANGDVDTFIRGEIELLPDVK